MKGRIRSLGKDGVKTYFYIKGENGQVYFARILDVESYGAPKSAMYPYIWEGALVTNFDVRVSEDGKVRAVNILLSGQISRDAQYWNGRMDALKEFAYWYLSKGEAEGFAKSANYLNRMIGWAKAKIIPVNMGAWHKASNLPKENVPVLLQAHDVERDDTVFMTAIRYDDMWCEVLGTENTQAIGKIRVDLYVPEAWMPLPDKWEDRRIK